MVLKEKGIIAKECGVMKSCNLEMDEYAVIPLKEKGAYCIGSVSFSVYYFLILSLCIYFFTDVVGMSATVVGSLVMISRIFDGVSDLIAGMIIDNTKSRFGKAQIWMIRFIVPTSFAMVLMYCMPVQISDGGKIAYFLVTYNLAVTVCYTMSNTAMMTLPSMMTRNQKERSILFSIMMFLSPVASAIGISIALPMVDFFGGTQKAWIITMSILGVIGSALIIISALNCKERVREETVIEHTIPYKERLLSVVKNGQWWLLVMITCMYSIFLVGFSTMMTYFSTYFIGDTMFTTVINNVQSYFMAAVSLLMVPLTKRFKKSLLVKAGMLIAIPGQVLMCLGMGRRPLLLAGVLVRSFGFGLLGTAMYIMISDCIEYSYWRTGVRADAMITSASAFGNKMGVFFAGGLFPFLMGVAGYDGALTVQPESAMSMIKFLFMGSPIIVAVLVLILMLFYRIDKEWEQVMIDLNCGKFHPQANYILKNRS